MEVRSQQDLAAGLVFIVTRGAFAVTSLAYPMGAASRMGPGYFPFGLSLLLTGLGLAIAVKSIRRAAHREALGRWNLKGIVLILGAVVLFAQLLHPAGLIGAIFVSVVVAALADRAFHVAGTAAAIVVLLVICVAGFVYSLGLQMPVLPAFMR